MFLDDGKVKDKQIKIKDFIHPTTVARFSANSYQAKVLTEGVANFIIKDMSPVSTVDGEGFVSLMEVAKPLYSFPM